MLVSEVQSVGEVVLDQQVVGLDIAGGEHAAVVQVDELFLLLDLTGGLHLVEGDVELILQALRQVDRCRSVEDGAVRAGLVEREVDHCQRVTVGVAVLIVFAVGAIDGERRVGAQGVVDDVALGTTALADGHAALVDARDSGVQLEAHAVVEQVSSKIEPAVILLHLTGLDDTLLILIADGGAIGTLLRATAHGEVVTVGERGAEDLVLPVGTGAAVDDVVAVLLRGTAELAGIHHVHLLRQP